MTEADDAVLRNQARAILLAGLEAADAGKAVNRLLTWDGRRLGCGKRSWEVPAGGRLRLLAAGKAARPMASAVETLLGGRLDAALGVSPYPEPSSGRTRFLRAGHPLPDHGGVEAVRAVAELAADSRPDDLLLCLFSGGASSLLPAPAAPVTLVEKCAVVEALLRSGASITELNTVRKHLSSLKGGGLLRLAAPARVLTLLLSDVVADDPAVIASGPTAPDPSTFAEALAVLDRRLDPGEVPDAVRERLERGARGEVEETVKPGDPLLERAHLEIAGGVELALAGAAAEARRLGYRTHRITQQAGGEAREVGSRYAAVAARLRADGRKIAPHCLLAGGETTVKVRGEGLGGRNQELVLAATEDLAGLPATMLGALGTDGIDGPTDAAGALADGTTFPRAADRGLVPREFLERNDAYRFFRETGGLLITGPTRTNVMDLHLLLLG